MKQHILITAFALFALNLSAQTNFVEMGWRDAAKLAEKEQKYLFIDCYTDWCSWCKVADKNTFVNEEVASFLNENFISVKVDMERGEGVFLGAKYRVLGYPSYLMFTPNGSFAKKMSGYIEDPSEFISSVKESLEEANRPSYPSKLTDEVEFPDFYINSFTNSEREEKRKNPSAEEIEIWLKGQPDMTGEAAWSVLYKFPLNQRREPMFIKQMEILSTLYGQEEVKEKLSSVAYDKLQVAIKSKDEADLKKAIQFTEEFIPEDKEQTVIYYQMQFSQAKEDWSGYLKGASALIELNGFKNHLAEINGYCWNLYLNCEKLGMLETACKWMNGVCEIAPEYAYLDTYAAVLFKSGRFKEALEMIDKALEVGKKMEENVEESEQLREKILTAMKGQK